MIPVPKPKFYERKIPSGQSQDDFLEEICARQTHDLCNAIDRVSFFPKNDLLNFAEKVFFDCHYMAKYDFAKILEFSFISSLFTHLQWIHLVS